MNEKNNDFQARLQVLRDRYAASLPEKITAINTQWQCLDEEWDWGVAVVLHQMIHNLAGSGASFGYAQLSVQAREIDVELRIVIGEKVIPAPDDWAKLVRQLTDLQNVI